MTTLQQDRLFNLPERPADDRAAAIVQGMVVETASLHSLEPARQSRRLPDRLLVAIHQACDLGALDIAAALLEVMNDVVRELGPGSPSAGRRAVEGMVAAHHRLWHLRRGKAV